MHCLLWQRHSQLLEPEGSTFVSHMRKLHRHGCASLTLAPSASAHAPAVIAGVTGIPCVLCKGFSAKGVVLHADMVLFQGCCPLFIANLAFSLGVCRPSSCLWQGKEGHKCAAGYVRRTSSRIIPDLNGNGKHLTIGRPIALDEEEYEEYMRSLKNGKQK